MTQEVKRNRNFGDIQVGDFVAFDKGYQGWSPHTPLQVTNKVGVFIYLENRNNCSIAKDISWINCGGYICGREPAPVLTTVHETTVYAFASKRYDTAEDAYKAEAWDMIVKSCPSEADGARLAVDALTMTVIAVHYFDIIQAMHKKYTDRLKETEHLWKKST